MLGFLKTAKAIYDRLMQDRDILRLKKAAPEIAAQITAGAQTVTRIVEERFAKKSQDDQPLFVVLGENHLQPAHQLLQMLAIGSLWEKGYMVAIGHERPYDSGLKAALELLHANKGHAANTERLKMMLNDDYGRMVLAHVGFGVSVSAYSHDLAAYSWMRRGISMAFNDAARNNHDQAREDGFNMQDQLVQQMMADHDIRITEKMDLAESPAVHLRNRIMVKNAGEHAREQQAEIYIQLCGNFHVAGFSGGFCYDESLIGLFRQQGQAVVGIPICSDADKKWVPLEAMQSGDVVVVPLPPGDTFEGVENPQERKWLEAVMSCLEPDFDFDRALTRPVWKMYFTGKAEHQARYWKRSRGEGPPGLL